MEVEKPPAAAELVGEATEVTTEVTIEVTPEVVTEVVTKVTTEVTPEVVTEVAVEVLKKEECVAETLVTAVTAAVGSFDEKSEAEEKEPEDTGKIEEEDGEVEKERIWREGGEEEEKGRAKMSTGPCEVRTCLDVGALLGGGR